MNTTIPTIYRRKNGGRYYIHDDVTGKQESLGTSDRATAVRLFHSKSEAVQQPAVNLQIARAYLAASDPQVATRNWQFVMADYYLVAHALAHGHTVVTHEKAQPLARKIKIPNVCIGLKIKCVTPFEMLRLERARFILGRR